MSTYISEPFFEPSVVYGDDETLLVNEYRTSSSAFIERHETPIVRCIEQRFAQFQGNIDIERIEPLQVVKYTSNQQV